MVKVCTFNRRILKVPYLILATLVGIAVWRHSWWYLAGMPLIYLGWACAAPNANLADGCLPQLLLIISVISVGVARILGEIFGMHPGVWFLVPVGAGWLCWLAWLACSLELAWRCATGRTGVKLSGGDINR